MSKVQDRPLNIPRLTFKVVIMTAALLSVFRLVFPTVWQSEVSLRWWLLVVIPLMIFIQHIGLAGFEWTFHRWVLHSTGMLEWLFNHPGLRWLFRALANFKSSHEMHHGHTKVVTRAIDPGPGRTVLSDYSMVKPEQFESSAFPPWALLGFWAFFLSVYILPLHFLMPRLPWIITGIIAVALGYWLYETVHSIHHYPDEWWKAKIEHPRYGAYFRRRYAFHQFHHYRRKTNLEVGGVLTFEWWDRWLRTYHYPRKLLIDQHIVTAEDIAVHEPWPWIVRIDNWVSKREDKLRERKRTKQAS